MKPLISTQAEPDPLLAGLGGRVRMLRARRAMPRRVLAELASVSERHIANLESGSGNVSILVLQQIAHALDCPVAELLGDETTGSPEWLMIRKILGGRGPDDLQQAHKLLAELFPVRAGTGERADRIAFIGLRGAGKSTLGRMVAAELKRPFIELRAEVARLAGGPPAQIEALYGSRTFQRYERQALEETLHNHKACVIATAGGIASDPASLQILLSNCFTVWLQATPEDHMNRVIGQGDLRPVGDSRTAIEDLRLILESRAAYYDKADFAFDTSGKTLEDAFAGLMRGLARHGLADTYLDG